MKTKTATVTIKPFKNRNSTISNHVAGRLLGWHIRKNFKTHEQAIAGQSILQLKQVTLQAAQ